MVTTRSKVITMRDDDSHGRDEEDKTGMTRRPRRNYVITIAPSQVVKKKKSCSETVVPPISGQPPNSENEEERSSLDEEELDSSTEDMEEEEDEFEEEEEEFELPESILQNKVLRQKAEAVVNYIKANSPCLETILSSKLRKKQKAELFEWFMIYENSMPMSEERMILRRQLNRMIKTSQKEFVEYKKYKKEIKQFEENQEDHNDLAKMQFEILRLETNAEQKQVLYRKFAELREKDELDEEFYKLKGWLRQALLLPFDRIKQFYAYDHVTTYLQNVKRMFDEELYGMEKVKEQLLLFIHGKVMNPDMKGCCLGLIGEPGVGKCLHPLTEVLMYDGSVRTARTLQKGDVLMGDDSTPRVIESMCSGHELMYKIHQQNGEHYIVNSSHILTLYHTKSGSLVDMALSDFVKLSKTVQTDYCGVKAGVEFSPKKWNVDISVQTFGRLWASQQKPNIFLLTSDILWETFPIFLEHLQGDLYRIGDSFPEIQKLFNESWECIPQEIKVNSSSLRIQFLQGVIEVCGLRYDLNYHVFLRKSVLDDFVSLTRSLGLYTKKTRKHSVTLCDPLNMIRYGATSFPVYVTYEIQVQKLDVQEYVGFYLSNNHRFLLKDFTVTHNTSIARCLAKVLDFPFEQISFGGVNHADFIKGFDFTYVGSRPGEIARCLSRMQYKNGIIFFDEYEKVSQNIEITSSLLHITDFSQNATFRDNFFNELTIDLSSIWFIYSMNELPTDKALRDRIYTIEVDGYSVNEKIRIASDYLLPKNSINIGLKKGDIIGTDDVFRHMVQKIGCEEKGIRNLERAVKDTLNKIHFLVTNQQNIPSSFMLPDSYFPLSFPVKLDNHMVNVFLKGFKTDSNRCSHFYL